MLSSPYGSELDLWGFHFSRPNLRLLSLRPDDLLTILKMALSIGFRNSVSLLSAIQATRLLTFASVGLSPTEHSSLSWTHFRTAGFPQYGWKVGFQVAPSLMLRGLSQHQAYPAQYVGLRPPFVHSAATHCVPHCVGTVSSVAHRHARSCLLYPRGPRSGLGYIVPVHLRLIDLIRPTPRHIPFSPHGGLYGMPSLCWCA
jgi:hypothetical protein